MQCSDGHPNYQGAISTLLSVGQVPLALEMGCEFAFIRIAHFNNDDTDSYHGVWGTEGYAGTTNGETARGK
jgi:hypothetical protein